MSDREYQKIKDTILDWSALVQEEQNCYLVILSDSQINLLLAMTKEASWPTRWQNFPDLDSVETFVSGLEYVLVNACTTDGLERALKAQYAAIASLDLDLAEPLPDEIDHTSNGLSAKLEEIAELLNNLTTALDTLAINESVDDLEEILDAVNVILGGAAILGA
jgi:hypothetical protein